MAIPRKIDAAKPVLRCATTQMYPWQEKADQRNQRQLVVTRLLSTAPFLRFSASFSVRQLSKGRPGYGD